MQSTNTSQLVPSKTYSACLQTTFQEGCMKVVFVAKINPLGILYVNKLTFRWTIPTRLQFSR